MLNIVVAVAFAMLGVALLLNTWRLLRGPDAVDVNAWLVLGVDRLSALVLVFATLFALLIAVYSVRYMRGHEGHRAYFAYLQWTLSAACGAVRLRRVT